MDVSEAVDRLVSAHSTAGLGRVARPPAEVETTLAAIAKAIAPLRLPADLLAFWRGVDPDTLAVAPCPRPADPELALRLWQEHLADEPSLHRFFPWCYESHDFLLVELDGPDRDGPDRDGTGCCSWGGQNTPAVRAFASVTAYVDLLATMIDLREFTHHPELGVIEFDPARYWADAQAVRLAASDRGQRLRPPTGPRPGLTTVASLRAAAEAGDSPVGVIRARVLAVSGSASGTRIEVSDGTGTLDVWCPAALNLGGPIIERRFDFEVALRPGCPAITDAADELSGVERATRRGDLKAAVMLATPLYDRLFRTPAAAQARAIRPARLRASRGQSRTACSASARNGAGIAVSRWPSRPAG